MLCYISDLTNSDCWFCLDMDENEQDIVFNLETGTVVPWTEAVTSLKNAVAALDLSLSEAETPMLRQFDEFESKFYNFIRYNKYLDRDIILKLEEFFHLFQINYDEATLSEMVTSIKNEIRLKGNSEGIPYCVPHYEGFYRAPCYLEGNCTNKKCPFNYKSNDSNQERGR